MSEPTEGALPTLRSTLNLAHRALSLPILSRDQVVQHVVDRRYGFATPETLRVSELLISMHPDTIREAEEAEAYLIELDAQREDPVEQFERLTGRRLRQLDENPAPFPPRRAWSRKS